MNKYQSMLEFFYGIMMDVPLQREVLWDQGGEVQGI